MSVIDIHNELNLLGWKEHDYRRVLLKYVRLLELTRMRIIN
jgi:hypothetical protein